MSLLDKALLVPVQRRAICSIEVFKDAHPELAKELDELLAAHPSVPYSVMEKVLKAEVPGNPVRSEALSRHNRGSCACVGT